MSSPMLIALVLLAQSGSRLVPDSPIECGACEGWNQPHEPFQVYGNTYYVGVGGLSALLIATDDGLILLDGALPQSAALIDGNIRALGFDTDDIRLIVNSHAHFDHAGGIGALQRASGATVAASPSAAEALRAGMPSEDDPQAAYGDGFPAVENIKVVDDGETVRVGEQAITVHFTPGHTPGGTSWTWRSCEGERCFDMVYADSLTAVSAPGYRFTAHPEVVGSIRKSIGRIAELPCDIMVSTHPEFSNLFDKLARRAAGDASALVESEGCRDYAAGATKTLEKRLEEERSGAR